ncbi:hypothetical protein Q5P01_015277 [Channa striata]|uniref:Uncharacterized protein n=1 Tax=Channa striata TaxID=64152 RepID=A0AA88MJ79_CHASR|nr:hypothetical protein Q5P01_015277 [Channa striata]
MDSHSGGTVEYAEKNPQQIKKNKQTAHTKAKFHTSPSGFRCHYPNREVLLREDSQTDCGRPKFHTSICEPHPHKMITAVGGHVYSFKFGYNSNLFVWICRCKEDQMLDF